VRSKWFKICSIFYIRLHNAHAIVVRIFLNLGLIVDSKKKLEEIHGMKSRAVLNLH